MKTKKSFSLILAVLMLFVASVASAALTPNADGVYEIGTAAQLGEFRDGINDGTIPADSDAKLIADITLTGNWKPIGWRELDKADPTIILNDYCYSGIFDGNGKTIQGLKITAADSVDYFYKNNVAGFFGAVSGDSAVVKNLIIENADVSGPRTAPVAAGIAVGQLVYGKVQNVSIKGGRITNYIAPDVTFEWSDYIGGLVGVSTYGEISNCSVTGMEEIGSYGMVGGIVSAAVGPVFNCFVDNVAKMISESSHVGVIAGRTNSGADIRNCYGRNIGEISSESNAGGLVGYLATGSKISNLSLLSDSSTQCRITGSLEGGIVGNLQGAIANIANVVNCFYPSNLEFINTSNKPIGNVLLANMDAQYNVGSYDTTLPEEDLPAIVVALDSYMLTLTVGESRTFDASTLPGKAGDFACEWGVDDASIASVAGEGLKVTVTGVAVGSSTVTAKIRGDINVDLSCIVNVVEETEETDPTVTGKPSEDGTIFPGEDVYLEYDFSPYIAIGVDNSGMQTPISGLLADILDGKVVVMGVSKEAGTYFYVVTLQRPDGSTFTQKVYVTIQGGSRPIGDTKSGGGSSNCNTGVGAALFALFGLALIQKRK